EYAAAGGVRCSRTPGVVTGDFVIVVDSVQLQADFVVVAELPAKLQPRRVLLLVVDIGTDAVGDVAVVIRGGEGYSCRESVRQRSTDSTFALYGAEVAASDLHVALRMIRGRGTDVLNETAGGITAEQGALRAAQHFDPLQVEHRSGQCAGGGDVGIVRVDSDRCLLVVTEIVLGYAAQVVDGYGGAVLVVLQSGHLAGDVGDVFQAELLQRRAVERRDRRTDVLQVMLTLLSCDNDFGELVAAFLGRFLGPHAGQDEQERTSQYGCCGLWARYISTHLDRSPPGYSLRMVEGWRQARDPPREKSVRDRKIIEIRTALLRCFLATHCMEPRSISPRVSLQVALQRGRWHLANQPPVVMRVTAEIHDADGLHQVGDTLPAIGHQQGLMERFDPGAADIFGRGHVEGFAKAALQCSSCNAYRGGNVGHGVDVGDVIVYVVPRTAPVPGGRMCDRLFLGGGVVMCSGV